MPFSMALPTTPTPTVGVDRFGEDAEDVYASHLLAFRRTDNDPPSPEVHLGDVLQGKGKIEFLPVFLLTNHEHFVGGGLEGIGHRSEDLTCVAYRGKPDAGRPRRTLPPR